LAPPLASAPPRWAAALALALRRLFLALADLVVPAPAALVEKTAGLGETQALRAVSRLGVADLLAAGPRTADELAAVTGTNADALHRALRALASRGIFRLDRTGRFANSRLSSALRRDRPDAAGACAEFFGSPASSAAWAELPRALATGEGSFSRVHGVSIWDWLEAHPDERDTFAAAMGSVTWMYAGAVASRPVFDGVGRLCDVGGGRGTLLAEILRRHPRVEGVLLESFGVLDAARAYLSRQGVLDRVELHSGSFFDAVPAGCDAYLLKQVLHDWDDERCLAILRNCRRALAPGGRLLVVESLVERCDARDFGSRLDLQMLVACEGGRERGREEFRALLAAAGFELRSITATACPVWILEAVAV